MAVVHDALVHVQHLVVEWVLLRVDGLSLSKAIRRSKSAPGDEGDGPTSCILLEVSSWMPGHVEAVRLGQLRYLVGFGVDVAERSLRKVLKISLRSQVHRVVQCS